MLYTSGLKARSQAVIRPLIRDLAIVALAASVPRHPDEQDRCLAAELSAVCTGGDRG
jgi:hypothetical protein